MEAMELNVWTSSQVTKVVQDPRTGRWNITVEIGLKDSAVRERIFNVKHVIFAQGFSGGRGYIPEYPGMVRYSYVTLPVQEV